MQRKRLVYLLAIVVLLVSSLPAVAMASPAVGAESPAAPNTSPLQQGESPDTLIEQAKALDAEQNPAAPAAATSFTLGGDNPLFMGVDSTTVPAYLMDVTNSATIQAFVGTEVWGSAYDPVNDRVLFNAGAALYEWPVGGSVNLLGNIVDAAGATQVMVGLAFYNGQLYGTKNITNEAIWAIDTTSLVATVFIDYVDADLDCGGFSADPNNGTFYCTNDDTAPHGAGLVIINPDASVTPVAAYPAGQTDIDGLAVSDDGHAYLVIDEPGNIYVYDLVGGAYVTPLTSPWTTSELFSAGAYIPPAAAGTLTCNGPAVGFEDGAFPPDWSITTLALPGGEWLVSTDNSSAFWDPGPAPEGVYYASANDDAPGSGSDGSEDYLYTNIIDLSAASSASMDFQYHFDGTFGQIAGGVQVSPDGGSTWNAEIIVPIGGTWQAYTLDLSAYVGNNNVQVRFHSDDGGNWASGYGIDDVSLACDAVGGDPNIDVDPLSMESTQATNTQVQQTLTISNTGGGTLNWTIDEEDTTAPPNQPTAPDPNAVAERIGTAAAVERSAKELEGLLNAPQVDLILDGSYEAGSPNPFWTEFSTNFGTPLCTVTGCGAGTGTGPRTGLWWAWFGGIGAYENGSTSQAVVIPSGGAATLKFWVEQFVCSGNPADYLEVAVDGAQEWVTLATDPACGVLGYREITVDLSAYADGNSHTIDFISEIFGPTGSNFFVDDVSLEADSGGGEPCEVPSDIPWLTLDATNGSNGGGTDTDVTVTFDSTGYGAGTYTGNLCVGSDDPDPGPGNETDQVIVPVTMTVEAGEAPNIDVSPLSMAASQATNTQTNQPLTVANTGGGTLNWVIDEENTPAPLEMPAYVAGTHAASAGMAPNAASAAMPAATRAPLGSNAYSWNSQSGPYYTVFDIAVPGTLPNIAAFPAGGNFVGAGEYYNGLVYMMDNSNTMYEVNPVTGAIQNQYAVTAPPGGETYSGMAVDPTTGVVYASSTNVATSSLFSIVPSTGVATLVGPLTGSAGMIAISFDGAGDLYGYDIVSDSMYSINKANGAIVNLGALPFDANFGQGMGYDPATDTVYLAAFNGGMFQAELWTYNTGANTYAFMGVLGSVVPGGLNQLSWLGFADGGAPEPCTALSDIPWLSLDVTNGSNAGSTNTVVTATFDSTSLADGVYTGNLCVTSNDPDAGPGNGTDLVIVPVTLTVLPPTAVALTGLSAGVEQMPAPLAGLPLAALPAAAAAALGAAFVWRRRRE